MSQREKVESRRTVISAGPVAPKRRTTRRHHPEDITVPCHLCENLIQLFLHCSSTAKSFIIVLPVVL
jgi:hypothetical protein